MIRRRCILDDSLVCAFGWIRTSPRMYDDADAKKGLCVECVGFRILMFCAKFWLTEAIRSLMRKVKSMPLVLYRRVRADVAEGRNRARLDCARTHKALGPFEQAAGIGGGQLRAQFSEGI